MLGGNSLHNLHLLIADNDEATKNQIAKLADNEGYAYDIAADGITAIKMFRRHNYDIIVMDIQLPMLDGWNVCRQLRKISDVPIIIVSALKEERDKLLAFESGADDFLSTPFSSAELAARIKVFLYRSKGIRTSTPEKIAVEGLVIDSSAHIVYVDDNIVRLTPKEYDLLNFLSQNPNKAFSREMLLNEVWGYEFTGADRTVDTHIKMLRKNIAPYDSCIATVWGFGYKFIL